MSVGSRRTGQHPLGGGQTEFFPNGFGGGGIVADIFRDPSSVGGSSRNYSSPGARPIRWGGDSGRMFPITAVTYPKFGLFTHVVKLLTSVQLGVELTKK